MDEREVECSRCDNMTTIVQEDIPSGWICIDEGWTTINQMRVCPKCKERYLKHRLVLGEHSRKYPVLIMHPAE